MPDPRSYRGRLYGHPVYTNPLLTVEERYIHERTWRERWLSKFEGTWEPRRRLELRVRRRPDPKIYRISLALLSPQAHREGSGDWGLVVHPATFHALRQTLERESVYNVPGSLRFGE